MTQFLDYLTAHPWAAYLALGLLSLVLARKSQFDAWAETNPRVAGVMKLLRGLGIDPWLVLQSFSLIVRGKLPEPPKPKDDPPTTPRSGAAVGLVLALSLLAPGLPACSSAQSPQAQAAQARNYGRVAYSAATLAVETIDEVSIAAMQAAKTPEQAKAFEGAATQINAGLHAARKALAAVRPWLEGGSGGSAEKKRLLEALDSALLAATLLDGAGVKVPPEVMQGVEAARALLGGAS